MEKINTKDALENDLILGNCYGYTSSSNGVTVSTIGYLNNITKKGRVTLIVIKSIIAYSFDIPSENKYVKKGEKVSGIKALNLFPINEDNINLK